MTATPCRLLHDYIAHDLTGDERTCFEAHLPSCLACRRIVQEEQALENLLSSALARLEPVPHDLIPRLQRRLRSVPRRRVAAGIAAMAAAVVILAWLSRPLFLREVEIPAAMKHEVPQPRLADVDPPRVNVRVRFPRAARVIAIPVASDSPHVTVVQVYSRWGDEPPREGVKKGGLRFNQGAKYEHD